MNLINVRIALSPLRSWEAMDLGLAALFRWRAAVYGPWLIVSLPLLAVLCIALRDHPAWIPVGLWLLKPWLARIPLFVLSRAVFGPAPGMPEVLAATPRILAKRPWLAFLSQRFSFRRALMMPVDLLEEPKYKRRASRLRVLGLGTSGAAVSTAMLLFTLFEFCLYASFGALCFYFGPETWAQALTEYGEYGVADVALAWILSATYIGAVLLIEPAFVAASFGIYLCRRTELEGWDTELGFRALGKRLLARRQQNSGSLGPVLKLGGLLFAGLLAFAPTGRATSIQSAQDPAAIVQEILATEPFDTVVTSRRWVPPDFGSNRLGQILAQLLVPAIWLALAVAIVLLIAWLAKQKRPESARTSSEKQAPRPTQAFGLDLREDSFPADIARQALQLWEAGQLRAALSLLYRGALVQLIVRDAVRIHASDTEQDCVDQVNAQGRSDKSLFFERLTEAWLYSAWGARPPTAHEGSSWCRNWSEHFGARS